MLEEEPFTRFACLSLGPADSLAISCYSPGASGFAPSRGPPVLAVFPSVGPHGPLAILVPARGPRIGMGGKLFSRGWDGAPLQKGL